MSMCDKCGSHAQIHTVEVDKETKKKWDVTRCARCEHPTDLEPYKAPVRKQKETKLIDPYDFDQFKPF